MFRISLPRRRKPLHAPRHEWLLGSIVTSEAVGRKWVVRMLHLLPISGWSLWESVSREETTTIITGIVQTMVHGLINTDRHVLLPASDMPTTNSSSGWTLNGKTGFYNSSIVYCQLLSEYVISCACVPLCYTGAFCFGCFGTNWCCWQRVPSRFMRKIICRLRLNEVSRQ